MFNSIKQLFDRFRGNGLLSITVLSLAIRISGLGLTLITTVFLTNILSTSQYGVYIYIFSVSNLATLIIVLGTNTLLIRQTVVYLKSNQFSLFRGIQIFSLGLCTITLIIFFCLMIALHPLIKQKLNIEYFNLSGLLFILLPLVTCIKLIEGLTRGLHAPIAAQLPDQIIRRIVFLVFIGTVWLTNEVSNNAYNIMAMQVLATGVALLSAYFLCKKYYPKSTKTEKPEFNTKPWLVSCFTLAGTTILQSIVSQIPIIFLGYLSTSIAVAHYSVIIRTGSLLNLFIIAANMSIAGLIAKHNHTKDITQLSHLATKSSRLAFSMALPLAILVILYAHNILSIFGDEYAGNATLLRMVVIGYLIHIGSGPAAVFLQMTYKEKFTMYASVGMFVFNLALSYILILHFDLTGALIAFMSSFLLYKLIIVAIVWNKVGIDTSILGMSK